MDNFEKIFASMWKISKDKGISRKDIAEEINLNREKHLELVLKKRNVAKWEQKR